MFKDPWALNNALEAYRIQRTSNIIQKNFGRVESLLEIGCAEGTQSKALSENCSQLVCVDVSKRAVRRARRAVPGADFFVTDVFTTSGFFPKRFELVVACEIIYLLRDVSSAIRKLESLGNTCLVTYMDAASTKMTAALEGRSILGRDSIECENITWHVVWWQSPPLRAPDQNILPA